MQQLVHPQFQISGIFYRDEPVVVIAATDALTVEGRRVAWRLESFRDLAKSKGFARASALELPDTFLPNATVLCGVAAISVALGAGALDHAVSIAPTDEWRSAVSQRDAVGVLLVRPRRRRRTSSVASLLRSGRAFAGVATSVSLDGSLIAGRYQFVGHQATAVPVPKVHTVLLDTSVLVDLEHAAAGRGSPKGWLAIQHLALQLAPMDVFPGPGILEVLCERGSDSLNTNRAHSIAAAMNAWFDGGIVRTLSLEAVREAYREQMGRDLLEALPFRVEEHIHQQVFYASLLKLACLWSRARGGFKARERVGLFSEFVHWMSHELRVVSPLPLQIARDRLVGPQGYPASYTDRLMKLGKDPLDDLWGASWDLVHLESITMFEAGGVTDIEGRDVVLATADRGLVQLRERIIDLPGFVEVPFGRMPGKLARFDVDRRLHHQKAEITHLSGLPNQSAMARLEAQADRSPSHIAPLIAQLELDVVAALKS
ncbi:MAG TPA: hypothetical protein DCQ04_07950 [Actinobacteria bacterium]|nr:hypothetical protein [Actinomycetota bacterium]